MTHGGFIYIDEPNKSILLDSDLLFYIMLIRARFVRLYFSCVGVHLCERQASQAKEARLRLRYCGTCLIHTSRT